MADHFAEDIYRLLQLTAAFPPSSSITTTATTEPPSSSPTAPPHSQSPFHTTYNLHKPHAHFRKSAPGVPHFRICVVSARETALPTLAQLAALLDEQPSGSDDDDAQRLRLGVPGGGGGGMGGVYARLKRGRRNIVLAVVDQGVASYMRVAEAPFGEERLWEREGVGAGRGRGGKGGGGGGRGRGGARGRGGGRGRGTGG